MITLRRDKEHHHEPLLDGFGALEILAEDRVPPSADVPRHSHEDADIVTYVREGVLAYEDSAGRSGVIHAGEFQRMTAGRRSGYKQANASRSDWAHVFQICLLRDEARPEPRNEQKRFSAAERRGVLCLVASRDARRGSLRIQQDAFIFSAMLDPGQHVVHELSHGRSAWLHLVHGSATLGDIVLSAGDGAGISAERAVSVTAREYTEILLLDLGTLYA
jgi:quercetin 2,3-dioxygenase